MHPVLTYTLLKPQKQELGKCQELFQCISTEIQECCCKSEVLILLFPWWNTHESRKSFTLRSYIKNGLSVSWSSTFHKVILFLSQQGYASCVLRNTALGRKHSLYGDLIEGTVESGNMLTLTEPEVNYDATSERIRQLGQEKKSGTSPCNHCHHQRNK